MDSHRVQITRGAPTSSSSTFASSLWLTAATMPGVTCWNTVIAQGLGDGVGTLFRPHLSQRRTFHHVIARPRQKADVHVAAFGIATQYGVIDASEETVLIRRNETDH
ncbi:hypothetical protein QP888_03705 [Corynebacterium sp. MSK297]|nr:hypothetical protein [Corynebacterium sp. MSK297]MDK8845630.1 hypothetical protein [Corynebacterium sp. MSK297]